MKARHLRDKRLPVGLRLDRRQEEVECVLLELERLLDVFLAQQVQKVFGSIFSVSRGWGLEGWNSRGPLCYFLALLSFEPDEAPVRSVSGDKNGGF